MKGPAWVGGSLEEALASVERVAREHGYRSPRRPAASAEDLLAAEARFGFALPADLRAFMAWHDPDLWSFFVNPEGVMISDHPTLTMSGELITRGHERDRSHDVPAIRHPSDCYGGVPSTDALGVYWSFFAANRAELGRPDSWLGGRVVSFGDSGYFEQVVYCIDGNDSPPGAIVTFVEGIEDRIWLADSLAAWLARIAACDGVEYAFAPGDVEDLPRRIRKAYLAEFNAHNPNCPWHG